MAGGGRKGQAMRIQELIFIIIGVFLLIGAVQEEVRERWRSKKNSTRS